MPPLHDIPDLAAAGGIALACGGVWLALIVAAVGAVDLLDWLIERRRSKCE